jgi:acyl-coenzyme A synthetase/AMP-(fatty) acid ligase
VILRRLRCYTGRRLTSANLTDALLWIHGNRPALRLDTPMAYPFCASDRLTYGDLQRLTAGFAAVLADRGVARGQRVGIVLPNGVDFVLWCLAAMRLGATAVPLNARLKDGEILELLQESACTTVVVRTARRLDPAGRSTFRSVETSRVDALPPGAPAADLDGSEPCAIFVTSGTTGRPKAAVHTSRGLLKRMHLALLFPALPRGLVVMALPAAHIMGMVAILLPLIAGVPAYFIDEFDADRVLRAIARERAGLFVGVPAMFRLMAESGLDRHDLRSMRAWISAADAVPPALVAQLKRHGALVRVPGWRSEALFVDVYGSVELGGAVFAAVSPPGARPGPHGPTAYPLPGCRTRITDPAGHPLAVGALGELHVRTASQFRGYVGGSSVQGAWVATGDLARATRLGGVRIEGRVKDVIKCGGYSVLPFEIERVLAAHPGVRQVVAFGVPHPTKGQAPVAAIVPAIGEFSDVETVLAHCRVALADYKVPRRIILVRHDEIPVTESRKVIRTEFSARYAGLLTADATTSTALTGT